MFLRGLSHEGQDGQNANQTPKNGIRCNEFRFLDYQHHPDPPEEEAIREKQTRSGEAHEQADGNNGKQQRHLEAR